MKKILMFVMVIFMSCSFTVFANETSTTERENNEITDLYLKTGLSFTHFSINGNIFYNYYDSSYAPTIVEIISVEIV